MIQSDDPDNLSNDEHGRQENNIVWKRFEGDLRLESLRRAIDERRLLEGHIEYHHLRSLSNSFPSFKELEDNFRALRAEEDRFQQAARTAFDCDTEYRRILEDRSLWDIFNRKDEMADLSPREEERLEVRLTLLNERNAERQTLMMGQVTADHSNLEINDLDLIPAKEFWQGLVARFGFDLVEEEMYSVFTNINDALSSKEQFVFDPVSTDDVPQVLECYVRTFAQVNGGCLLSLADKDDHLDDWIPLHQGLTRDVIDHLVQVHPEVFEELVNSGAIDGVYRAALEDFREPDMNYFSAGKQLHYHDLCEYHRVPDITFCDGNPESLNQYRDDLEQLFGLSVDETRDNHAPPSIEQDKERHDDRDHRDR